MVQDQLHEHHEAEEGQEPVESGLGPEAGEASVRRVDRLAPKRAAHRLHHLRGVKARAVVGVRVRELRLAPGALAPTVPGQVRGGVSPLRGAGKGEREPVERASQVRDYADRERTRDAQTARIHVDLNQLLLGIVAPILVVGRVEIAEARAQREDDVRFTPRLIGAGPIPIQMVRMVLRRRRSSRHAGDNPAAELFSDFKHSRARVRAVHARANDDERVLGAREKAGHRFDLRRARLRSRRSITLGRKHRRARRLADGVHHGGGDLQLNGTRPARPHLPEGHAHHIGNARPGKDRRAPFYGRTKHVELILALECAGRRRVDDFQAVLCGDRDQRHPLVARIDHARQEVGGAGAWIGDRRRDLAGCLVQPFGHVDGGGLVTHGDEPNAVGLQGGEERIHLRRRQPEHKAHAFVRQASGEQFAAGQSHDVISWMLGGGSIALKTNGNVACVAGAGTQEVGAAAVALTWLKPEQEKRAPWRRGAVSPCRATAT